jgi:hypothetical protein
VNKALWLLLGFQLRGWLRSLWRGSLSFKRSMLGLIGLVVVLAAVLLPVFLRGRSAAGPEQIRTYGPTALLLYCVLNLVVSAGERAVYFPPAEVNLLFPAPLSRREVLLYKILSALLVALPTSLIIAVLVNIYAPWHLAAYISVVLAVMFLQLFSMVVDLAAMTIGASFYSRARILVAVLMGLVLLGTLLTAASAAGISNMTDLVRLLVQSPGWQVLTWPLRSFFDAFLARDWGELAQGGLIALGVDLGMVALVLLLDVKYLETAAAASKRIYERQQQLRRGELLIASLYSGKTRWSLPALPWWGGLGPILWRQLLTVQRGLVKLILVFVIFAVVLLVPLLVRLGDPRPGDLPVLQIPTLLIGLTMFLTPLVPFDFRGDIDRLALLKTLPVSPWRLAVGQLLTPVLVISVMHGAVLAAAVPFMEDHSLLLPIAAAVLPVNFFLFAVENLLFLLYPTRVTADLQGMGRNVVLFFIKGLLLLLVLVLAIVTGALVWLLTTSHLTALPAGLAVVVLCDALLVPLVALAFRQFDIGRETPA